MDKEKMRLKLNALGYDDESIAEIVRMYEEDPDADLPVLSTFAPQVLARRRERHE